MRASVNPDSTNISSTVVEAASEFRFAAAPSCPIGACFENGGKIR